MKTCKICGKSEPEVTFYKSNSSVCKECVKERVYQNRVKKNTEQAKLLGIEYSPRGHNEKCPPELLGKGYKYCNECKQWLPLSEFGFHSKKGKGRRYINSVCKKCACIRTKQSPNRKETVKFNNEVNAVRREIDLEFKKHLSDIDKKYNHSNRGIIMKMLQRAKTRAALLNKEFNLEPEDIIIPEYCPILGLKLEVSSTQGGNESSPSLDRIDSSKGYIKGNIQVISRQANIMKNSADSDTLKKFAKYYINK